MEDDIVILPSPVKPKPLLITIDDSDENICQSIDNRPKNDNSTKVKKEQIVESRQTVEIRQTRGKKKTANHKNSKNREPPQKTVHQRIGTNHYNPNPISFANYWNPNSRYFYNSNYRIENNFYNVPPYIQNQAGLFTTPTTYNYATSNLWHGNNYFSSNYRSNYRYQESNRFFGNYDCYPYPENNHSYPNISNNPHHGLDGHCSATNNNSSPADNSDRSLTSGRQELLSDSVPLQNAVTTSSCVNPSDLNSSSDITPNSVCVINDNDNCNNNFSNSNENSLININNLDDVVNSDLSKISEQEQLQLNLKLPEKSTCNLSKNSAYNLSDNVQVQSSAVELSHDLQMSNSDIAPSASSIDSVQDSNVTELQKNICSLSDTNESSVSVLTSNKEFGDISQILTSKESTSSVFKSNQSECVTVTNTHDGRVDIYELPSEEPHLGSSRKNTRSVSKLNDQFVVTLGNLPNENVACPKENISSASDLNQPSALDVNKDVSDVNTDKSLLQNTSATSELNHSSLPVNTDKSQNRPYSRQNFNVNLSSASIFNTDNNNTSESSSSFLCKSNSKFKDLSSDDRSNNDNLCHTGEKVETQNNESEEIFRIDTDQDTGLLYHSVYGKRKTFEDSPSEKCKSVIDEQNINNVPASNSIELSKSNDSDKNPVQTNLVVQSVGSPSSTSVVSLASSNETNHKSKQNEKMTEAVKATKRNSIIQDTSKILQKVNMLSDMMKKTFNESNSWAPGNQTSEKSSEIDLNSSSRSSPGDKSPEMQRNESSTCFTKDVPLKDLCHPNEINCLGKDSNSTDKSFENTSTTNISRSKLEQHPDKSRNKSISTSFLSVTETSEKSSKITNCDNNSLLSKKSQKVRIDKRTACSETVLPCKSVNSEYNNFKRINKNFCKSDSSVSSHGSSEIGKAKRHTLISTEISRKRKREGDEICNKSTKQKCSNLRKEKRSEASKNDKQVHLSSEAVPKVALPASSVLSPFLQRAFSSDVTTASCSTETNSKNVKDQSGDNFKMPLVIHLKSAALDYLEITKSAENEIRNISVSNVPNINRNNNPPKDNTHGSNKKSSKKKENKENMNSGNQIGGFTFTNENNSSLDSQKNRISFEGFKEQSSVTSDANFDESFTQLFNLAPYDKSRLPKQRKLLVKELETLTSQEKFLKQYMEKNKRKINKYFGLLTKCKVTEERLTTVQENLWKKRNDIECSLKGFGNDGAEKIEFDESVQVKNAGAIKLCSVCSYSTHILSNFKRHLLIHKASQKKRKAGSEAKRKSEILPANQHPINILKKNKTANVEDYSSVNEIEKFIKRVRSSSNENRAEIPTKSTSTVGCNIFNSQKLVAHNGSVNNLIVFEDDLYTCSNNGIAKRFRLKDCSYVVAYFHSVGVNNIQDIVVERMNNETIVCTRSENLITMFCASDGRKITSFISNSSTTSICKGWGKFYSGCEDGFINIYCWTQLESYPIKKVIKTESPVFCLACTHEGNLPFLIVLSSNGKICIRGVETAVLIRCIEEVVSIPCSFTIYGNSAFFYSSNNVLSVFNCVSKKIERKLLEGSNEITGLAASEKHIVTISASKGMATCYGSNNYSKKQMYNGAGKKNLTCGHIYKKWIITGSSIGTVAAYIL